MAYASVANLFDRYDRREVCSLISDSSYEELGIDASVNSALIAALADASGDIEAALLRGGRYAVLDLTTLSGNSLSLLNRMACDIAFQYLLERRPGQNPDRIERQRDLSRAHLKRLAKGEDIFDIQAVIGAGQVHTDGPTIDTFTNLNLIRDRTQHYFPNRRLPNSVVRN